MTDCLYINASNGTKTTIANDIVSLGKDLFNTYYGTDRVKASYNFNKKIGNYRIITSYNNTHGIIFDDINHSALKYYN